MRQILVNSLIIIIIATELYGQGEVTRVGTTAANFLGMEVGTKAIAMGVAFTAIANDATAIYWNPAGLANSNEMNLIFSNQEWLAGSNNQYLGLSIPTTALNLGLTVALSGVSDIERRDERPTVEPLGYFSSNSLAMAFSVASGMEKSLKFGVTAKFLYEKVHIYTASGLALDFGIIKKLDFLNLKTAFVMKDLGSMSTLNNESTTLPTRITGGLSSGFDPGRSFTFNWAFDVGKYFKSGSFMRLGGELTLNDLLSLRGGYRRNSENSSGITAGIGIKLNRYSFDYAYLPFDFNLGDTHQISFSIGF